MVKSCNIVEYNKMSDVMQFSIKVALRIYGCVHCCHQGPSSSVAMTCSDSNIATQR